MRSNSVIILGCLYHNPKNIFYSGRRCVYDSDGIAPTIVAMGGRKHAVCCN